jgi:hypothetical protein
MQKVYAIIQKPGSRLNFKNEWHGFPGPVQETGHALFSSFCSHLAETHKKHDQLSQSTYYVALPWNMVYVKKP